MTYRAWLIERAPRWLRRKWGARWLYVSGVVLDAWRDASVFAVKARFPSKGPSDALAAHGDERRLERLPGETDAGYVARLRQAFPAYRESGSATGLQNRLREAGFPTATVYEATGFAPNGQPWARFWVVIFDPTLMTVTFRWGDGTLWGTGVWGGVDPAVQAVVRKLIAKWKAPYAHLEMVTVVGSGRPWGTFRWGDGTAWGGSAAMFGA